MTMEKHNWFDEKLIKPPSYPLADEKRENNQPEYTSASTGLLQPTTSGDGRDGWENSLVESKVEKKFENDLVNHKIFQLC